MSLATSTDSLPSLGQWRLLTRLLIRSPIGSECRASRMLDRTNCEPGDLGELAEEGMVAGHREGGEPVDLAVDWYHGLAHVFLRITKKGSAWLAGNPHTRLLFEIADAPGSCSMKPAEVRDQGEVLQQSIAKRLITVETEDGVACTDVTTPDRQVPGERLYLRLTKQGMSIVSP